MKRYGKARADIKRLFKLGYSDPPRGRDHNHSGRLMRSSQ
jgi:hypothetical protein